MKAIVQNAYGGTDVLTYKEIDKPAVKENEVLVRVHAAALNAGDVFSMKGSPWVARFSVGFPKPNDYILGWDMAGVVESVGAAVTKFNPGDAVYAACSGTLAEYVSAPEDVVAHKPANLTFEQAAAVPTAALTALKGLRDVGQIKQGHNVLINGASGGVGTFAVQIAKAFGAEVTAVCSSRNADMVRAIGADHVIDYTKEDFTQSDARYDRILDNIASRTFAEMRRVLTPEGFIIPNSGHGGMGYFFKAFLMAPFMSKQGTPFVANPNSEALSFITELIESGKITPVIDKTYPLNKAPEALGYVATSRARGKVVIAV